MNKICKDLADEQAALDDIFITFYSPRNCQTFLGRSGIARGLIKNN